MKEVACLGLFYKTHDYNILEIKIQDAVPCHGVSRCSETHPFPFVIVVIPTSFLTSVAIFTSLL